jgi:GNAT superfamily N-acetyltransferase
MTTTFVSVGYEVIDTEVLQTTAALFSSHYARWRDGTRDRNGEDVSGKSVKLTAERVRREFLFDERCGMEVVECDGVWVGHALFVRFEWNDHLITWITQLVVHSNHRRQGLATELCRRCCRRRRDESDDDDDDDDDNDNDKPHIVGIISSNPYSFRALQIALNTPAVPLASDCDILDHCPVEYMKGKRIESASPSSSVINTNFPICHRQVLEALSSEKISKTWNLGLTLPPGHEFIALFYPHPSPPLVHLLRNHLLHNHLKPTPTKEHNTTKKK